jgi:hypothetical protein
MPNMKLSPIAQTLDMLLKMAALCETASGPKLLKERLEEVYELFQRIRNVHSMELAHALHELHINNIDTNIADAAYTLLQFKERLNTTLKTHIDWDPSQKEEENLDAVARHVQSIDELSKKETRQDYVHTVEFRWAPSEIFASKSVFRKYMNLLEQAGIVVDSKIVSEWLSTPPRARDLIEIDTVKFEEAIKNASYDETKAKAFENNPPALSFKMKTFLADVQAIRKKPKLTGITSSHMINSLQLEGGSVAARIKFLREKHHEILAAINSQEMACLVLGKLMGYDWEINVRNEELRVILKDVRNELKYSTDPRQLLAEYDRIPMKSGISKQALIKEFGLNPKDLD